MRSSLVLASIVSIAVFAVLSAAGLALGAEEASNPEAAKKDLLKRIDKLEDKLPPELARRLMVISMTIATGWCSPFVTKEFEDEIDKLPERDRKKFEKEWKLVREHEAWPSVAAAQEKDNSPPSNSPANEDGR